MKFPISSLAGAMIGVTLVAINLAALLEIYRPPQDGRHHFLIMSVLPMVNAIAIVGPLCFRRGGSRRRALFVGFTIGGLAAMLGHVACDWMFPDTMLRLYSLPFDSVYFYRFCRDHLPWYYGVHPDGAAYWHNYVLLSVFYCWPQFLVAVLGGLTADWLSRRPSRRGPA